MDEKMVLEMLLGSIEREVEKEIHNAFDHVYHVIPKDEMLERHRSGVVNVIGNVSVGVDEVKELIKTRLEALNGK